MGLVSIVIVGDQVTANISEGDLAVGVKEIGVIGVDKFPDHGAPLLLVFGILGQPVVIFGRKLLVVEILVTRVVPVIRHPFLRTLSIGPMGGLKPRVACREMLGDSEGQTICLRCLLPEADHILVRTHLHGVPPVELGIPEEEVVVVGPHADEILCARLFVESHEGVGIPFLSFP